MPSKDPRRRSVVAALWNRANRLTAKGAMPFRNLPSFLGTSLVTRIIVALAKNGPARKVDLYRTVATNYPPMTRALGRLHQWGVVSTQRLSNGHAHFLNPHQPAYQEILELCRAIAQDYTVPTWAPVTVTSDPANPVPPERQSCRWFGSERASRILLFVYSARGARITQISRFIGDGNCAGRTAATLERFLSLGILAEIRSTSRYTIGIVFDPQFRYHAEFMHLLDVLTSFHTDVEARGLALSKVFPSRRLSISKVN